MKAAQIIPATSPAKKNASFFNKGGEQDFFHTSINEQPFFSKSKNNNYGVQTKLTVGSPNDIYEKEADAMADKVVQRLAQPGVMTKSEQSVQANPFSTTFTPFVQKKCAHCEEEEKLQKKGMGDDQWLNGKLQKKPIFESDAEPLDDDTKVQRKCDECEKEEKLQKKDDGSSKATPSNIESRLSSSKSSGSPLPASTREQMENSFGANFSNVRIHNNSSAMQMSKDLNAQAFTHGNDIYFNSGKYDANSQGGKHLLAHELTHTLQQGNAIKRNELNPVMKSPDDFIMRSELFTSTINICQRVLTSRTFHISNGGLKANLYIKEPDLQVPNCKNHPFYLTLTKVKDWWVDSEVSSCTAVTGGNTTIKVGNLAAGDYYFTIWRSFDHPYCCVDGEIEVFDEATDGSSGCNAIKQPTALEIVHDILDGAGFIPVLGAIPDGINAVIYATEGDWTNVGISAIAMVPEFGDAASLTMKAEKAAVKIEGKAALKLEKETVEAGLKEAKASAKESEKLAADEAEKLAKEAAEKKIKKKIERCLEIYAVKEALGDCPRCKGNDTKAERATKIACLTAEIAARREYLKEDCDDYLQGSIDRKKKGQDPKGGHQTQLAEKITALAKCATLPTK